MTTATAERIPLTALDLPEQVRERVERGLLTWSQIARELGWMRPYTHHEIREPGRGNPRTRRRVMPDTGRIQRQLGLKPASKKGENYYYQQTIDAELAERICDIAGLDPWEVGL